MTFALFILNSSAAALCVGVATDSLQLGVATLNALVCLWLALERRP